MCGHSELLLQSGGLFTVSEFSVPLVRMACSGEQVGKKKLTPWGLWVVASLWPELTYSAS